MSQVVFHLDAPDRAGYTCRLLRKAASLGTKVLVTGERIELDQLDGTLWCFAPREFVPHCRSDAPAEVLQRSAVILASPGLPQALDMTVLVHLSGPLEMEWGWFEKGPVPEVISIW